MGEKQFKKHHYAKSCACNTLSYMVTSDDGGRGNLSFHREISSTRSSWSEIIFILLPMRRKFDQFRWEKRKRMKHERPKVTEFLFYNENKCRLKIPLVKNVIFCARAHIRRETRQQMFGPGRKRVTTNENNSDSREIRVDNHECSC